ncbi:SMUF2 ligase, partial [Eolophus roseicapillus]|nr:SMUF2 ligase [Eolophus roseicapilla]
AVEFFDEERRARLLQFVTGSSRVPLQGFKALQGNCSGSNCKCLYLEEAIGHIPETLAEKEAGWLFNRIDIPPYESYDKLYEKLLTAIEETCGFAVE